MKLFREFIEKKERKKKNTKRKKAPLLDQKPKTKRKRNMGLIIHTLEKKVHRLS